MPKNPQHDFLTTELDPNLLSTPFKVQTNWHVLTGAPCCGKTTLIGHLADKGFQTVPETGRWYVEREIARGRASDEIRKDESVQRGIQDTQLRIESALRATDVVFLDGAVPSSLTYSRLVGLNPNEILAKCFRHRYASVFLLDRFPFQANGTRFESDAAAALLGEWLARDYSALGYSVVRVPVLSREERLAFILEGLSERGLL